MKLAATLAAVALGLCAGTGLAQAQSAPPGAQTLFTPRGPAIVTGRPGGVQTAILPQGGTGVVTNNGNGTSTIVGANGQVTTVPNQF